MEDFSSTASTAMRDFVAMCQTPVVVLLLAAAVFVAFCVGALIVEYFTEHRHFKAYLPKLVDDLRATVAEQSEDTCGVIERSGLLTRQKRYLIELTRHPELTSSMRESLAVDIEHRERARYDGITKVTDILARVSPMLGLLGTLIPLGPGIMALSRGNTETLSASLLTAFDTTSVGLIVACFALLVSAVRNRWYKAYLVSFDAAMECVLEVDRMRYGEQGTPGPAPRGASREPGGRPVDQVLGPAAAQGVGA